MNFDATIGNASWFAASLPEWLRYRHAASNLEAVQRRLLRRYLRLNAATEFGRTHGFDRINSWEEFAGRVPIRTYDDFQPWIERIANGSTGVLTAERVALLEPSSGSSGPEKWIPYTKTLQAEFRRAVAVWITQNFINSPGLMGGRAYWSLTPQVLRQRNTDTSVPVGFDEDSAYLGGFAQRLIEMTLATLPELRKISDVDRFWHVTLLLLLKCRDLRLISVWHPSYALLLLQQLRRNWTELLADLRAGLTLSIPALQISADVARASELETIGAKNPAAIWPALGLISCWGDANAAGCLEEVRSAFPDVQIQPKGLVATEAFTTLPLGDFRPLAVRSHFFEFLDHDGNAHPAWSLQPGRTYSMVVTTGGGLYRYRIQDQVEVTGYFKYVPSLRFVGKEDNISDYFGEKLNETFVAACLNDVFDRHGLRPQFAMLALDKSGAPPCYTLYIQCRDGLLGPLDADLESKLRQNPHYDLCVRLGQLKSVSVLRIGDRAYETYAGALTARGMRLGDIKPTPLSRYSDWTAHFSAANEA